MRVLVTSASRKLPLLRAIRDQLGQVADPDSLVVIAGDCDPRAISSFAWPDFWAMPRLDEPADRIVAAIVAQHIEVLIPTRDGDVDFFAQHRDRLNAAGVHCLVSTPASVALCRDKLAFADALLDAGLPGIPTSAGLGDPRLGSGGLVVKERTGAGSIGLAVNVAAREAALAAADLSEPIFQPFVPGQELSLEAYRTRDGRVLGLVARTRDLVIDGESAVSTTVDAHPYAALVTGVLRTVDLQGHALIQVIEGPDGVRVVECNARLGGASTLSLAAGLRSLAWFVLESDGADPAVLPFTHSDTPLRLVRVAEDLIDDPGL